MRIAVTYELLQQALGDVFLPIGIDYFKCKKYRIVDAVRQIANRF